MKITKRYGPADFGEPSASAPAEEPEEVGFDAPQPMFRTLEDAIEPPPSAPLSRATGPARVATQDLHAPVERREVVMAAREPAPSGLPIYLGATVVFGLWACAPIAFALGARAGIRPFDDGGFALGVLALLVAGPGALIFIAAYLLRQGQRLAAEARRAKALADELVSPAIIAAGRTSEVVRAVRAEIDHAGEAAEEARETLLALRDALAAESERLIEAAAGSTRTAQTLAETLGRERAEMGTLSESLDVQATKVADVITQQARMVAEASDLAETQLREAEALLAARAADLAAAAGEANDAARTAGEDLNRHISRLETAGVGVAQQINAVEMGLTEQRAALFTVAQALRKDHEAFAAETDGHTAQLGEFIAQARLSAVEMGDRAVKGGETLRQLMASASDQLRELTETVHAEREVFGQSTLQSIGEVSKAAADERALLEAQTRAAIEALAKAAEDTRAAAAKHAETAREQVDQLSEAAFTAGQNANQVFEARLEEARALIQQSAEMVEKAGAATAQKLDDGAKAARATLLELQDMMSAIDARASQLPATAKGQAEQVRIAVSDSMEELLEQARRTAEETEAIDAAFHDRVRRNYEMLSDAVRLMGSMAGGTPLESVRRERPPPPTRTPRAAAPVDPGPPPPEPTPETPPKPEAKAPTPRSEPKAEPPPKLEPTPTSLQLEAAPEVDDLLEPPTPAQVEATGAGLRSRIKFTPTATDEEFSSVFAQATGRAAAPTGAEERSDEGWTWKDLLSSIDDEGSQGASLDEMIVSEISGMGIDPAALLPKARIEEIAAAVQTGDAAGAREVVRKLAPAATRRISRRIASDAKLKENVESYLKRYDDLLADAVERDHAGMLAGVLLGSEAGRAYLLLHAAAAD